MKTGLEYTYEDFSITDPKERQKHFGQYDHVRWYGMDYFDRLKKLGLMQISIYILKSFQQKTRNAMVYWLMRFFLLFLKDKI